jgi:Bacteriophage tail sheath protein
VARRAGNARRAGCIVVRSTPRGSDRGGFKVPTYRAPGLYIEEIPSGSRPIQSAATSTAAFIGAARKGPINQPTLITSFADFERTFGGPYQIIKNTQEHYLYYAVAHFFLQGGSRCYIVRVAHYLDPNSAASLQATPAACTFAGTGSDGSAVATALTVSAINPGEWGGQLEASAVASNAFSLVLAADIAQANGDTIALELNDHVHRGSLLHIVDEVSGQIASIDATTSAVKFTAPGLTAGSGKFTGPIAPKTPVYGPRLSYIGATSQAQTIADGVPNPDNGIILSTLKKVDGSALRVGDVLTFAITEAYVVVDRVTTQAGTPAATVVHFKSLALKAFKAASSRVYAPTFSLLVRRKGDTAPLEVHENLSLVNTDQTNHVNLRLGPGSGASQYITANDETGTNDLVVINNADYTGLTGGKDGLSNTTTNSNNLPDSDYVGNQLIRTGLYALTAVGGISILVVPNASEGVTRQAITYCENRRDLFLLLEKPRSSQDTIAGYRKKLSSDYAALYDPWISVTDLVTGTPALVPPSGAIAGIYALTDTRRGVHKAPAGLDTGKLVVADGLERAISKGEYDTVYPVGINAILKSRDGIFVWGSRTLWKDPQWQQINVRRLFVFLEQSILAGTQWVTFEPNDLTLWKSIERNVGAFLRTQWLEGKLVGATEKEAFFVHCDAQTNPPEVVSAGQVVTVIGVAPSRPAEFVVFRIKQTIGQGGG